MSQQWTSRKFRFFLYYLRKDIIWCHNPFRLPNLNTEFKQNSTSLQRNVRAYYDTLLKWDSKVNRIGWERVTCMYFFLYRCSWALCWTMSLPVVCSCGGEHQEVVRLVPQLSLHTKLHSFPTSYKIIKPRCLSACTFWDHKVRINNYGFLKPWDTAHFEVNRMFLPTKFWSCGY